MVEVVLHLNFSKKEKATAFLTALLNKYGLKALALAVAPYSKFDNQFRASFTLSSDKESNESRIYELLQLTHMLIEQAQKDIKIIGPSGANDSLAFEAIVNCADGGVITWANLSLTHA